MIGIATADWHLWHRPMPFREAEEDWFAAMQRPVDQIKALQVKHQCPILFAGDLFERWSATPEMISWAIKHMPTVYGVPGNHDLPNHRYADIKKSAYWTMVEAGKIINVEPGRPYPCGDHLLLYGYPCGHDDPSERPPAPGGPLTGYSVAMIHSYIWTKTHCYPDAPLDSTVASWEKKLKPFDISIFGDNHKGFISETKAGKPVVNCGSLMRTKRDQAEYKPRVTLIWSDGDVERHYLNISADAVSEDNRPAKSREVKDDGNVDEFIASLAGLEEAKIDFVETVRRFMDRYGHDDSVREKVSKALGGKIK